MARIKTEDLQLNIFVNGDKGRKEMAKLKQEIQGNKDAIASFNKALKEGKGNRDELNASIKKAETNMAAAEAKLKRMQSALKLNDMTLNELRKNLKLTKTALNNAVPGTEAWKKYNAELQATQARIKELSSGGKTVGSMFSNLKASVLPAVAAVAGLARGVKAVAETVADFEQANVNLSTILGVSIDEMKALTENAKDLGRTTQYTASQVTGLQTELAKLGFSQDQILAMTEPTLNFATAVGTDLSSAASLAGATLRIFGLQATDTEDTLSVLATATNKSALDFSYLQTAMSIVGPVAKSFGFSLRDTTALLGSLANAGFDASSAATATRNIFLNLANSSGKLAQELGGSVSTFPELIDGLKRLKGRGVDLNEALELTDKRSVSAFSAFLDGTDATNDLRDSLEDVSGELDRIAKTRMDTLQGSTSSLQSAWKGLMLSFSNGAGPLKDVIQGLANVVNMVTSLRTKMAEMTGKWPSWLKDLVRPFGAVTGGLKTIGDLAGAADRKLRGESSGVAVSEGDADFVGPVIPSMTTVTTSTGKGSGGSGDGDSKKGKGQTAWSLSKDVAYLTAKANLQKQFLAGSIATQDDYEEKLYDLEVASLTARLALNKEKGAARASLEDQLNQKLIKHKTDAEKKKKEMDKAAADLVASLESDKTRIAENAEAVRYKKDLDAFEKNKAAFADQKTVLETIERRHQNELLKIKLDAFDREQSLLKSKHDLEIAKIKQAYSAELTQIKFGSAKEKEELREQNLRIANLEVTFLQAQVASLKKMLDEANLSDEQRVALETKLVKANTELAEAQRKIWGDSQGIFSGTGQGSLFGVSQEAWEQFFERLKHGTQNAEDLVNVISGIGGAASEGFKIASQAIDLTSKKEKDAFEQFSKENGKKKSDLQARLDAGLMSQAQYNQAVSELEADAAARQEEMELAQARRSKALSISEATIQSALAVAKTFAQWGWPAGIMPAGIMAGLGAAQVAMIAATPISAYAQGGLVSAKRDDDKRGYISRPTILVGEAGAEYVIPADGLRNPTLAPVIASIETARRAGTLRSLNFGSVIPAAAMAPGGYSRQPSVVRSSSEGPSPDARALLLLEQISAKLDNPVPAVVSMLGPRGLRDAMESYERMKNRGNI